METGMIIFIALLVNILMLYYQKYKSNIICGIISLSLSHTHTPTYTYLHTNTQISTSPLTALELLSQNNEDITVDQTILLLSTIVNNQLNQAPEPVFDKVYLSFYICIYICHILKSNN